MNAPQQWQTWNQLALTGTVWPSAVIAGEQRFCDGPLLQVCSPVDGRTLGQFHAADPQLVDQALTSAVAAQQVWRQVPAPRRAELIRAIAERVSAQRSQLAELITLEVGKIPAEAAGEVQEWLDMCDFALGLSRQLHGLTIASERPDHRMMEQWHPLGVVGVISAFNFPMAVWAWNAMLALVCGNAVVWKPSEKTPLCALAAAQIVDSAIHQVGAPLGLNHLLLGEARCGRWLAADRRVALLSATGSVRMGRSVAQTVAVRLGRSLLELGGNNAMIVSDSADLDLALRAIVFSAVGTCGQRCTTLRRLIVHEKIAERLLRRLVAAYRSLPIGDPHQPGVLVGPLIDEAAWHAMQAAIARAVADGGKRLWGGQRLHRGVPSGGHYVRPALLRVPGNLPAVREETFAPILYVMTYRDFEHAIALQNEVDQGLSSAVFTGRMAEAERFMSAAGSDCGIANVNIGTSGAEIGGAFGGEKDTGGGRESGSDAWKNYMRRVTNTINYGSSLPLAQGICFEGKKRDSAA